ncbi:hypothetical protein diail_3108 [Diaporthe ilicicola]|nr:hypothetical protein diail_3108 [Diaporthe ilicicola]
MAPDFPNQPMVKLYLSSLWPWRSEGRNRILDTLESCNLHEAYFAYDTKRDWLHVQCLAADKGYVLKQYLRAQTEMEKELREKDLIQDDGKLIPDVKNDFIRTSRPAKMVVPDELHNLEEDIRGVEHVAVKRVYARRSSPREGMKPQAAREKGAYLF